jgi:hypothetical protein
MTATPSREEESSASVNDTTPRVIRCRLRYDIVVSRLCRNEVREYYEVVDSCLPRENAKGEMIV